MDMHAPAIALEPQDRRHQRRAGLHGERGRAAHHPGLLAEELHLDAAAGDITVTDQADSFAGPQPLRQDGEPLRPAAGRHRTRRRSACPSLRAPVTSSSGPLAGPCASHGGIRHRCAVTLAASPAFLAAVDSLCSILRATSSSLTEHAGGSCLPRPERLDGLPRRLVLQAVSQRPPRLPSRPGPGNDVIRVLPGPVISPVRSLPIRLGPGWPGADAGAGWDGRRGRSHWGMSAAGCSLCSGGTPLVRARCCCLSRAGNGAASR